MTLRPRLSKIDRRSAVKIAAIYAVGGCVWIYASSSVLAAIKDIPGKVVAYSVLEGVAFIALTACLLYYLVAGYLMQGQISECLDKVNTELKKRVDERASMAEASEERYRALVLASSDVLYRMSPDWSEMRELQGRSFLSDTGSPTTDWLQKYIHPDDQPHVLEVIAEAIRTKSKFELEHRVLRADGTIGWTFSRAVPILDQGGEIVEWVGAAKDVTGSRAAENAVKKSERKFSTFFHAASVFMSITTLEEGRVIDINEVALQALGYKREEVIGETVHLAHIWKDPSERERTVQVLTEQGSIRDLEIQVRKKGGGIVHGLLSAELIVMEGERWILSVVRDITTRKKAEEEVIRLNAELAARARELETANKELEAFNYMVAHDLRTPLNTMSTSCQAVERFCGEQLPPECREFLQAGYQSTRRMNQLIGALLDFSRMSHVEPKREEVNVSALAKEAADELRRTEPQREVEFVIAEGLKANADPSLLRIVLDNLAGNAWKYTARQEKPVIEFGALTMEGGEVFFVRDNGCGFEEAAAKAIFSPFQRLPGAEMAKGFGIGLATVQRIIERHGGRIWAEGEAGKGATFYFTLG